MKPHKCDICGRPLTRKIKTHGYTLCNKHYKQFKKYGTFLDDNPRTIYDKNEIHVQGDIAYVDLYDKYQNVIGQAIIDREDIPKIQYTKWKLSGSGYVCNTPKYRGSSKHMSREILGTDQIVDHINHNTLDNRKQNLRIITKSQNQMNSNYKGVSQLKNGKYAAHIKLHGKDINLGQYIFEQEAYFARWYAEELVFGEYRYPKPYPILPIDRENAIKEYVAKKVQRL